MVAIGIPETITDGLGAVGVAMPPWEQVTTAPTWRMGPGMIDPPYGPVTVSAVSLIATVGPVSQIEARPGPAVM